MEYQNSCTETEAVVEPSWSVDLQANYSMEYIRFTNRIADGMINLQIVKKNTNRVIENQEHKYRR